MTNLRKLLLVSLTAGLLGSACASESPSAPERVRITVNSWVGFGPLFVAARNGFFERQGLAVDVIKLENAPDRRAALLAKRVDIVGSSLDDLAVTASQGVDAAAFMCADFSNGGDGILAANGIKTLQELRDKPIAVQPGFVNHFFLLYVLDSKQISTAGLTLRPMTPDDAGAAFINGSVDAAVTWEPHLTTGVQKRKGAVLLASSREYPEAILDLFIAERSWLASHTTERVKFEAAWDAALAFIRSNEQKAMESIGAEIGQPPAVAKEMLQGASLLSSRDCSKMLGDKIDTLPLRVEKLWREAGYVKGDIQLRSRLDLK